MKFSYHCNCGAFITISGTGKDGAAYAEKAIGEIAERHAGYGHQSATPREAALVRRRNGGKRLPISGVKP